MRSLVLTALLGLAAFSCKDTNTPTPPGTGPDPVAEFSGFSPLSGKKGTVITLRGKHFGRDASRIALTINGIPASIATVADSTVTAIVPEKSGLGKLTLTVNGKELVSREAFRYLYTATTHYFSGSSQGYADGPPTSSKFFHNYNIVSIGDGTFLVADQINCMIRRIEKDGTVSTVAGIEQQAGYQDGKKGAGKMMFPIGVESAQNGSIYVADYDNHAIRKILPDGTLTTLAGHPDRPGLTDGILAAARFKRPYGVKLDPAGVLWVCDSENNVIRKISPDGQVTTFAGSTKGYADGKLREAQFFMPVHLTIDKNGNAFVADKHNHCIRKISTDGIVSTVSGTPLQNGHKDGKAGEAMFNQPSSVQVDKLGNIYVTDLYNHCIRMIYPDGYVITLAGKPGVTGYEEGEGDRALFYYPQGCALDKDENLFVTDSYNERVRKLVIE